MNPVRILMIFSLLLTGYVLAFAQWRKIDLKANPNGMDYVTDAAFVNADTGFVSTAWGVLFATTDGGLTWQPDSIGDSTYIWRVSFPALQFGYMTVSGANYPHGAVLKSIDGGKHWFNTSSGYSILNGSGLYFLNADTGFVGNDAGVVFKTIDGGQNWSFQFAGSGANPIFDLRFLNDSVGFIYQNGANSCCAGVNITRDGGQTWPYCQNLNFFTSFSGSAILYNDSTVVGIPVTDVIKIGTNQNEPAQTVLFTPPATVRFGAGTLFAREISFVDSIHGMVAYAGAVARTTDGGNSWVITDTSAFYGEVLQYLVGVNANKWLVMGAYAALYITDNGGGIATSETNLIPPPSFTISPNPTTGAIKITAPTTTGANYRITITNLLGQTVYKTYPTNNQIDVTNLAPGIYLLKLEANGAYQTAKFVKQ